MEIWHGLDNVPADFGDAVVTIGVFDGVHKGHKILVRSAVEEAAARGAKSIMMTFDPNPVALFAPDKVPAGLSTVERRAELAEAQGVDAMLVIAFDKSFASIEPEEFVRVVLGEKLHAKAVYVGENFTYGKMAKGTSESMPGHGEKFGIDVTIVPLLDVEADGVVERVSSSRIRDLLADGAVEAASDCLGYYYRVDGRVIHGQGRGGAQLGFPTANIDFAEGLAVPADGVYAAWFRATATDLRPTPDANGDIEFGVRYPAAVSVGSNVTFGDTHKTVEAFVIDRHADLYGVDGHIEFVGRIRGMEKFDGLEALIERMNQDVAETRTILENADAN
ncbi:bifunctional riboflavin kinase/FAD synthetase [Corynebacterium lactis]|uniref:Riboflavin biosynthesis protein n=1 Tax=Corynebacterium lactis RW2-5 TaxID=1408189 RepID=A0A0K2GZL6_9CORY|nr:bifunctional riboflavin kinase/FAD synthetase [Corynebacterium lactis]ALA67237.1 riboflavin kinase [Corynebacterium lactis RW2-5]